jgi:hypothetical protein
MLTWHVRLHFIPVSGGYDELYNIHAYFSPPSAKMVALASKDGTIRSNANETTTTLERRERTEGDVLLRKIARAGRAWKQSFGRPVDMEAYVYRLCLEYARLWADDRDAWGFEMPEEATSSVVV